MLQNVHVHFLFCISTCSTIWCTCKKVSCTCVYVKRNADMQNREYYFVWLALMLYHIYAWQLQFTYAIFIFSGTPVTEQLHTRMQFILRRLLQILLSQLTYQMLISVDSGTRLWHNFRRVAIWNLILEKRQVLWKVRFCFIIPLKHLSGRVFPDT